MFSTHEPPKKSIEVLGRKMAYVEAGNGLPVVFLHGNPTSSYLWRNILPVVAPHARCIAPDLIGMGDSEKLPGSDPARYGFQEHRRFLEALLDALGLDREVVLVGHDWGGALAIDWARRHPASVRGICYFETTIRPREWSEVNPSERALFEQLRSSEGEQMILQENAFVEVLLPRWVLRKLSEAEMEVYRRPFRNSGEDRRPTLTFPREVLIGGEPAHMLPIIQANTDWMSTTETPKLFINGDPGAIVFGALRELCRTWPNQREVTVRGKHYLQEDSPLEIGQAIVDWLGTLPRA
ncbi:haloalkane dehalogenase [Paraburkholderia pallida]|uniref:Haloalkane dehalogenase n=1 Tax=Paraburkholderia pallida TaxID=2547399 RepID=A0A4P7CXW2_9BURK|nr:haloalkane dehalogenase [Paraburkholderia pallida]QBQ99064.1 haloalkane dehalogenase [Paraburkholderia pallida]